MGIKIHYDNKEKFYDFSPIPAPEKIGGESGVPIEVSVLPEPTKDIVGKVYFNTTEGNYYIGRESDADGVYFNTANTFDSLIERSLTEIVSDASYIREYAFNGHSELESVIFPNATVIGDRAFMSGKSLKKIIIGTNHSIIPIFRYKNSQLFSGCYHITGKTDETYNPDGIKDGYIYVPAALVADYRMAKYWSTYVTQIMPYVATLDELTNIDGTTYDKACVGEDYTEYTFNGTEWEVYR